MLVARDIDNLLICGRCASATHLGMAGLRIQTHCHVMGQAAGIAAAMSVSHDIDANQVDTLVLQSKLRSAGVWIDEGRIEQARQLTCRT